MEQTNNYDEEFVIKKKDKSFSNFVSRVFKHIDKISVFFFLRFLTLE